MAYAVFVDNKKKVMIFKGGQSLPLPIMTNCCLAILYVMIAYFGLRNPMQNSQPKWEKTNRNGCETTVILLSMENGYLSRKATNQQ